MTETTPTKKTDRLAALVGARTNGAPQMKMTRGTSSHMSEETEMYAETIERIVGL